MSMTLTNAKLYVARVIGGQNDTNVLALAADAILATASKWTLRHNWEYLRKDNAETRDLAGTNAGGTVTLTSTAGLNVGQSVVCASLSVNTTIATIPSTTTITLTAAGSNGTGTFTFGAYVPVLSGIDTYFFPADFSDLYGARLLTNKRPLDLIRLREVNRTLRDQSATGYASAILFSPAGAGGIGFTAADQRARFRLVGIPDTSENLHLDYYRAIDGSATTLDVPDAFLYPFLDDAKAWLVRQKNANDPRADILEGIAERGLKDAIDFDSNIDDEDVRMKSQFETFSPWTYGPRLPFEY